MTKYVIWQCIIWQSASQDRKSFGVRYQTEWLVGRERYLTDCVIWQSALHDGMRYLIEPSKQHTITFKICGPEFLSSFLSSNLVSWEEKIELIEQV